MSRAITAADLGVPDAFNAAAYFVDRHAAEGRGAKVAIECGDDCVTYAELHRTRESMRQCTSRHAGRSARRAHRAPAARRAGVRLGVLRSDQDRRGADSHEHAVEDRRLSPRAERFRRRASRSSAKSCCRRSTRFRAPTCRRCATSLSRADHPQVAATAASSQLLGEGRRTLTRIRRTGTRPPSGCIPPAAPAHPRVASICTTTW